MNSSTELVSRSNYALTRGVISSQPWSKRYANFWEFRRPEPHHTIPNLTELVERFNSPLLSLLSIAVQQSEEDWYLKIPTIMLVYRSSVHESTGGTPFSLMFGREAQLPVDRFCGSGSTKLIQGLWSQLNKQKSYYDTSTRGKTYKKGDWVWLHCPAVPKGSSCKLHRPWQGPYVVLFTGLDI